MLSWERASVRLCSLLPPCHCYQQVSSFFQTNLFQTTTCRSRYGSSMLSIYFIYNTVFGNSALLYIRNIVFFLFFLIHIMYIILSYRPCRLLCPKIWTFLTNHFVVSFIIDISVLQCFLISI